MPPDLPPLGTPPSMRLLEIFAAMMEQRTTIEAAEVLGISQPGVSAALRQLETHIGLTLFHRTGRYLEPTSEARNLYDEIRPIFGIVQSFVMRAENLKAGRAGYLRIIATPPAGYSVVPDAIRQFMADRPDVSLHYDVRRLSSVIEAVQTGDADIGIGLSPGRIPSVNTEEIGRGKMVALVPGHHPLAAQSQIAAQDIGSEVFVGLERETYMGRLVEDIFERSNLPYRPRIETRYCQTAAAIVAAGLGVTIVDEWSARPYLGQMAQSTPLPRVVARPLRDDCPVRCLIFTRRGTPASHLLQAFREDLRAILNPTAYSAA